MSKKATATAGFDGPVHDDQGRRVIGIKGDTLLMDFTLHSERSYRGKAGWSGHNGTRHLDPEQGKPGTFAPELDDKGLPVKRKRWTTALAEPALDQLHELAAELGLRRCDVVERLLLDPVCRDRLRSAPPGPLPMFVS